MPVGGRSFDQELLAPLELPSDLGSVDGRVTMVLSRAEAEDFLFHEADLLENWRLDDWHALFLADGRYEIPALDDPWGDPRTSQFFVADNAELLAARITRLKSRNAHAEPPPRRPIDSLAT